jgi:hypothetical protein
VFTDEARAPLYFLVFVSTYQVQREGIASDHTEKNLITTKEGFRVARSQGKDAKVNQVKSDSINYQQYCRENFPYEIYEHC